MKKSNRQREQLLQKKRTKRNAARKGKTYNPHKTKMPNTEQNSVNDTIML